MVSNLDSQISRLQLDCIKRTDSLELDLIFLRWSERNMSSLLEEGHDELAYGANEMSKNVEGQSQSDSSALL